MICVNYILLLSVLISFWYSVHEQMPLLIIDILSSSQIWIVMWNPSNIVVMLWAMKLIINSFPSISQMFILHSTHPNFWYRFLVNGYNIHVQTKTDQKNSQSWSKNDKLQRIENVNANKMQKHKGRNLNLSKCQNNGEAKWEKYVGDI